VPPTTRGVASSATVAMRSTLVIATNASRASGVTAIAEGCAPPITCNPSAGGSIGTVVGPAVSSAGGARAPLAFTLISESDEARSSAAGGVPNGGTAVRCSVTP
jgi:hypothetical protein